jgi:HlyD family secretion protein
VEPYGFTKISALGVEEQRVNVIIDLLDPAAAANAGLGHGWRVDAAVETGRREDAVLAPVSALFRVDGGWAVFRVRDGRARLAPVEIGQNDGVMAEVLSGLAPGDTLVLYPGEQISDGARVLARD